MMTFDVMLLSAAAVSTVIILFGVVLFADYQENHPHPSAQKLHK
jgi:hypothetical protein